MHTRRIFMEPYVIPLPKPPDPEIDPEAFMLYPLVLYPGQTIQEWLWQRMVYQKAFEQAQAVVRPSLPERDLLAVWN